jgi:hypothetical protein
MSQDRKRCLADIKQLAGCEVICVYKDDVAAYIVEEHPLHPAYQYLSETHKADYLRTYFMNFHGGGYIDIKRPYGSWAQAFDDLEASDAWINGYPEIETGVAYLPAASQWRELIGNGAYICKPRTPLTEEWYAEMIALLDTKLERLKEHPATFPQDCAERSKYPIEWNEMLGRIFHRIIPAYKHKLLQTVPRIHFHSYR